MRTILTGDLIAAARVLGLLPDIARPETMRRLLVQAGAADAYRKRFNRTHPFWGNGSLMGAAHQYPMEKEPFSGDTAFLRCLETVCHGIIAMRGGTGCHKTD